MIEAPEAGAPAAGPGPRGLPAVTFRWWEALLAYVFGNLFIGGLAFGAVGAAQGSVSGIRLVVAGLALDVVFLVSLVLWLRKFHPGSRAAIGLMWSRRVAATGAGLGAVLYVLAAVAAAFVLQAIFESVTGGSVEAPEQMPVGLDALGKILFVLLAVVLAPVTEEVFFRGIFYRSVRDRHGIWAGLAASAVFFGLVHYQAGPLADAVFLQSVMVITGVGFALIYERAGNLVASIAAHVAFNIIGVTLILGGI